MKRFHIAFLTMLLTASYINNVFAAFQDNGDGTVSDDSTGLIWQKTDVVVGNFNSSLQYCQNLELGGYDDWRMPNVQESITLFEYPQGIPAVFDRTTPNQWTSDQKWDESYTANVHALLMRTQTYQDYHSVRCVRGSYDIITTGYLARSGEHVSDSRNNIIWTPTDDGVVKDFNSAKSHCENLVFAERSDWRLPTAKEIAAIADYSTYDGWGPMVNNAFTIPKGRSHYNYWSGSESYAPASDYRMRISFKDGSLVPQVLISGSYVLCVCTGDSMSPIATISGLTGNPNNTTSVNLLVGGLGVVSYKYSLDGGIYSPETDLATPINLNGLPDGFHTISVIGKNSSNNWQDEANATTISWTIDTTAPVSTILGTPPTPTNSNAALLTVGGTDVVSYKYKLDNSSYSLETPVGTLVSLNGLSEGLHVVSVIGKDQVGNWQSDATATTATWLIDLTAPSGTSIINNGEDYTNGRNVTILLNSADAVQVCFSNDNVNFSAWESITASKSWLLTSGDASKVVFVKYRDSAGNTNVVSDSIYLDTTPPDVPIPNPLKDSTENLPTVDWQPVSGCAGYILEYDTRADFGGAVHIENLLPSDYTPHVPLSDGTWYWRVRAVDVAGNMSAWSETEFLTINTNGYCDRDPLTPLLLSPADGEQGVSRTPVLSVSDFGESRDCSQHWKTRWQISEHADFHGLTLNANTFENLTTYEITKSTLKPSTTYYWRVMYWGTYGNKSNWSEVFSFTTEAAFEDSDDNGIVDNEEVDAGVDLDNDGTEDRQQFHEIKSVKASKGGQLVGIRPEDALITRVDVVDESRLPESDTKPSNIPYGMFAYRLELLQYGQTVNVDIHLSEPAPPNSYWVMFDPVDGWQDYSAHAVFNHSRTKISLHIKDGGFGDCDHTENGVIVDPGGIAVAENPTEIMSGSGGSGGGGCFILSLNSTTAHDFILKYLAALMLLLLITKSWRKTFKKR